MIRLALFLLLLATDAFAQQPPKPYTPPYQGTLPGQPQEQQPVMPAAPPIYYGGQGPRETTCWMSGNVMRCRSN